MMAAQAGGSGSEGVWVGGWGGGGCVGRWWVRRIGSERGGTDRSGAGRIGSDRIGAWRDGAGCTRRCSQRLLLPPVPGQSAGRREGRAAAQVRHAVTGWQGKAPPRTCKGRVRAQNSKVDHGRVVGHPDAARLRHRPGPVVPDDACGTAGWGGWTGVCGVADMCGWVSGGGGGKCGGGEEIGGVQLLGERVLSAAHRRSAVRGRLPAGIAAMAPSWQHDSRNGGNRAITPPACDYTPASPCLAALQTAAVPPGR